MPPNWWAPAWRWDLALPLRVRRAASWSSQRQRPGTGWIPAFRYYPCFSLASSLTRRKKDIKSKESPPPPAACLGPEPHSLLGDEGPDAQAEAYRWRPQSLRLASQLCDLPECRAHRLQAATLRLGPSPTALGGPH